MTGSQTFTACLKSLAKPDVVWVSQSSRTSCCTWADHQPPLRAPFMFVLMSGGSCCQSDVMIVSPVEVLVLVIQGGKQQPGGGKATKQLKGYTQYGSNTHNNTYTCKETHKGTQTQTYMQIPEPQGLVASDSCEETVPQRHQHRGRGSGLRGSGERTILVSSQRLSKVLDLSPVSPGASVNV